jgi:hypothetical protein
MDAAAPPGEAYFGSAAKDDPRNLEDKYGRIPFSPRGLARLTPWAHTSNKSANRADPNDPSSPFLGKVTHPAPAPDGNLLTVWSPGPVYGIIDSGQHRFAAPAIDSGIYLVKGTGTIASPGELLLVKNDPKVDEKWPRAVVPYRRIYGIDEPAAFPPVPRDVSLSAELPAATPFALFGAPSLYRRESYPRGRVAPGAVTASYPGGDDLHENLGSLTGLAGNWFGQGADAGKYNNSEIHALRILAVEPTTDPLLAGRTTRRWWSIANERFRIVGEIPVRKFEGSEEPKDSDGNPDTSFLVKLPADVAWTIQTLNKEGMVLNSAQTWHMLRPGEVRNNCGGCHAHSQAPMPFETTAAASPKYNVFDLTRQALLLTTKEKDESGRKWDADDSTGLRHEAAGKTVEFLRDVKPILERSCVACHTQSWEKPAGNLVLDDDTPIEVAAGLQMDLLVDKPPMKVPGSYLRLAADSTGKFGNVSGLGTKLYPNLWGHPQGSRYVRYMQSRRSLLAWKIFGKRMDGFRDDDFAHQTIPGDPASMVFRGKPFDPKKDGPSAPMGAIDVAFTGSAMPPPAAVAGTFVAPNGKKIRVAPLSDEDRRTIVRWIDLGCPIDLAGSDAAADSRAGWFADEIRPTLSLVSPRAGAQPRVERIQVGMFDYGSGLDEASFRVTASVPIDGIAAGENLGNRFRRDGDTWTLDVKDLGAAATPTKPVEGVITVSVRDRAGNTTKVERAFAVGVNPAR